VNLMRNALQHASGLTEIVLAASTDGTLTRLSVRDDGSGIAPVDLPRIFDPFFTAGKGTGLGLAIVRRTALAHGGRALVDSSPGAGTVFHIELPVYGAEAAPAEQAAV